MAKKLNKWSLLWISLTSMIGSGWLFGALYSAHFAGPAALLAWPIAGILLMFVALAYAEIVTLFPQPDALALMPLQTHGRLTCLIMTGLTWIGLCTIPVIETQGLIQYASNYLPHLMVQHHVRYTLTLRGYLFAMIILMSFVWLNYFGLRLIIRLNASFTIWKLIVPTITIIVLLATSYHPNNLSNFGGFMPYGWHGVMNAMSNGGVLFSLLGFRQVVVMMSDIEDPNRNIPIVLFASLLMTIVLYTLLQLAFIGSLRSQDLTHGWANLTFPGDAGPFAALATIAGFIWLSILLYIDAFVSPYSTGFVYSTTASCLLTSMSNLGDLPKSLTLKNKYDAPWVSLYINFLIALGMFFLLHDWQAMASFLVATLMMSYIVGPISLMSLRKQLPNAKREFKVKLGYLTAFIGFYVCTMGVYWCGFISILKLIIILFFGILLYIVNFRLFQKRNDELEMKHAFWLLIYFAGLGFFSYAGNFGGKHLFPPYWDLLALGVFCGLIFKLAYRQVKTIEISVKN